MSFEYETIYSLHFSSLCNLFVRQLQTMESRLGHFHPLVQFYFSLMFCFSWQKPLHPQEVCILDDALEEDEVEAPTSFFFQLRIALELLPHYYCFHSQNPPLLNQCQFSCFQHQNLIMMILRKHHPKMRNRLQMMDHLMNSNLLCFELFL